MLGRGESVLSLPSGGGRGIRGSCIYLCQPLLSLGDWGKKNQILAGNLPGAWVENRTPPPAGKHKDGPALSRQTV